MLAKPIKTLKLSALSNDLVFKNNWAGRAKNGGGLGNKEGLLFFPRSPFFARFSGSSSLRLAHSDPLIAYESRGYGSLVQARLLQKCLPLKGVFTGLKTRVSEEGNRSVFVCTEPDHLMHDVTEKQ